MNFLKPFIKIKTVNALATFTGWMKNNACGLRILTFHNIGDDDCIHTLHQQRFTDFISFLNDNGYQTIRALDLVNAWPAILDQEKKVILTFDDGYVAHHHIVSDLLSRFNMTATFFILSSLVEKERTCVVFSGHSNVFMSKKDIKEMNNIGFEIGSHTHAHPLCGLISDEQFRQEITLSKKILEESIGCSITSFSFPYGREKAYTGSNLIALAEVGYKVAFTQSGKKITSKTNLLTVPRINIDRFDTLQTFQRKLLGNYEPIFNLRNYAN